MDSFRAAKTGSKIAHPTNFSVGRSKTNSISLSSNNMDELAVEEMKYQQMIGSSVRSEANVADEEEQQDEGFEIEMSRKSITKLFD